MTIKQFTKKVEFSEKTELEKAELIALYLEKKESKDFFEINEIIDILDTLKYPVSNPSRLRKNIKTSRNFKKSNSNGNYTLHPPVAEKLMEKYGEFLHDNTTIISSSSLIDESKFKGKGANLDKLIEQINHCYEHNCYDACAVLMRKLFETLLIRAYSKLGIDSEIKNDQGNYIMLEGITNNAKSNTTLALTREPKKNLDNIRDAGNYSAHTIYYNATKKDIDDIKKAFRLTIEELYHKAGLL